MKVCIGVADMPYDYGDDPSATTHIVAEKLEYEYKLFTNFWNVYEKDIRAEVGEAVAFSIINHIKFGAPMTSGEQLADTMKNFNVFLEREQMAGLGVKGVPTQAALDGVNSRLKKTIGPRRPSFIDGGLLKTSFIAWIDDDANP